MNVEVIQGWIEAVHALAAVIVAFCFAAGFYCVGVVGFRIFMAKRVNQMAMTQAPSAINTVAHYIVGVAAIYLLSTLSGIQETVFSGVGVIQDPDPLSWRIDDTIPITGGVEDMSRIFFKKLVQLFGLVGMVKCGAEILALKSQRNPPASLGKAFWFGFGSVCAMQITATTKVLGDLMPAMFGGVATFFGN